MDLITLDFETYYDKEYSLKKLTTEEYIRDRRFEVIGVGVKVNNKEAEWASGTHEEIAKYWSTHLGVPVTALDVSVMMTLLKLARIKNGNDNLDNYIDGAGYLACGGELSQRG